MTKEHIGIALAGVMIIMTAPGCPESPPPMPTPTSLINAHEREIPCPLEIDKKDIEPKAGAPASSCRAPGNTLKCYE